MTDFASGISCPPEAADNAKKVRDIDDDGVKDWRFNDKTEKDEHGSQIERWCVDHGGGSQFVRMYIAGPGKPGAGKNKFYGHCKYDWGENEYDVEKKKQEGKEKFHKLTYINKDRHDKDPNEKQREYVFDAKTCKIKQTLTKQDCTTQVEANEKAAPDEKGTKGIGLPLPKQPPLLGPKGFAQPIRDSAKRVDKSGDPSGKRSIEFTATPSSIEGDARIGTGACCTTDGACVDGSDAVSCQAGGGAFLGMGTVCAPDSCIGQEEEAQGLCVTGVVAEAAPSVDTPMPINDFTVMQSIVHVGASGVKTVRQVNVDLDIFHSRVGDLVITLEHQGRSATLVNRIGQVNGAGFGCDADGLALTIDVCADQNIHPQCQIPVIVGRFAPDDYPFPPLPSSLTVFDGTSPLGPWILRVSDQVAGETGVIQSWEVHYSGDGDTGPASIQPPGALLDQQLSFPAKIDVVSCYGITATSSSNQFWYQVSGEVGPVEIQNVLGGSPAFNAGLQPGDIILEVLDIPRYLENVDTPLQDLLIQGGTVQLGHEIDRLERLGIKIVDFRLQRGLSTLELSMLLGSSQCATGACCTQDAMCLTSTSAYCASLDGVFSDPGRECEGDTNDDGFDDACTSAPFDPPTVGDNTCQTAGGDTGIPCSRDADCTEPAECGLKSRYLSVTPTNQPTATSIRVRVLTTPQFPAIVGHVFYAGPEQSIPNSPNPAPRGAPVVCTATPHSQIWTNGPLHLFGASIVPTSHVSGVTTYGIAHCDANGDNCSAELSVEMAKWGDVVRPFTGGGQPNFNDVSSIVEKFRNVASAPNTPRVDLVPMTPNQSVSFVDVSADVDAFRGVPYPFTAAACP